MRHTGVTKKFNEDFKKSGFDALLIFGFDHVKYLTGAVLPFLHSHSPEQSAVLWTSDSEPVLLTSKKLRDSFRAAGRIRNVQVYSSCGSGFARGGTALHGKGPAGSLGELVLRVLEKAGITTGRVGITVDRLSPGMYDFLRQRTPGIEYVACDGWMKHRRMVKTPQEQELLEEAARRTDHALAGAAHHVMVYASRPEKGLSEIIRVHCLERGLDMTGYEALAVGASGEHAAEAWPEAPFFGVGLGKYLKEGELVRMEVRASLEGYWSDAARLLTMGPPDPDQEKAYAGINVLREKLLEILQPGTSCSAAAGVLAGYGKEKGIDLIHEHGYAHGLGVLPVEGPYVDPSDSRILEEGMVLVLTPTVRGPKGELVRSYDTVIIEKSGPRLVGWYKDWTSPYKAVRSYQHGGG